MFKIMIVEDDAEIRFELKTLLEHSFYEVQAIDEFSEVEQKIMDASPDLVLLDVNLPNESGIRICSKLRTVSDVPIIFVTSQNTSMDELNCIMMGGDDFIAKPYNAPILLARIAAVLKRTSKVNQEKNNLLVHKHLTLDIIAGQMEADGKRQDLSKTELKILYYLIEHKGEIVPRLELVEYLWDNQVYIDDNTLSVNMTRIRNKLEEIGIVNYIETKRGLGYKV